MTLRINQLMMTGLGRWQQRKQNATSKVLGRKPIKSLRMRWHKGQCKTFGLRFRQEKISIRILTKLPSEEVLSTYPNVVQLLGDYVDNSGDILYSLGQDFTKMELIESMAVRNPMAAIQHMQKLSQSIKDNEAAGKVKLPNEPLHQMRPSNTGTDSGAMSVRDYRNKYKA